VAIPDQSSLLALWRSVIARALVDFIYDGQLDRKVKARREVIEWLDSDDFSTVCALADIEPSVVLRVIRYLINAALAARLYVVREVIEGMDGID
jgi:hypothetical protein